VVGKAIITPAEIEDQASSAHREDRQYRGCGCDDKTVRLYCESILFPEQIGQAEIA